MCNLAVFIYTWLNVVTITLSFVHANTPLQVRHAVSWYGHAEDVVDQLRLSTHMTNRLAQATSALCLSLARLYFDLSIPSYSVRVMYQIQVGWKQRQTLTYRSRIFFFSFFVSERNFSEAEGSSSLTYGSRMEVRSATSFGRTYPLITRTVSERHCSEGNSPSGSKVERGFLMKSGFSTYPQPSLSSKRP